jgi:hypothetical protein
MCPHCAVRGGPDYSLRQIVRYARTSPRTALLDAATAATATATTRRPSSAGTIGG